MNKKHIYHSHTKYCHHSSLSIEKLIKTAIEKNYLTIGISEHMPPNILKSDVIKWRLKDLNTLKKYLKEAWVMKKKYQKDINVLVGLECEIIDTTDSTDLSKLLKKFHKNKLIEYLIFGHHSYRSGGHVYVTVPTRRDLEEYVEDFKRALDLNVFLYVAHPDAFYSGAKKITDDIKWATKEIIDYAAKKNIPLGLNVNGISRQKPNTIAFPNPFFWKYAAKKNIKVVIELDIHHKEHFKEEYIKKAFEFAKKINLKIIDKLI